MDEEASQPAENEKKKIWPSVDNARPTEEGGSAARAGFNYQDEVAVSLLLNMLENPTVLKLHCETHDDTVVIHAAGDGARIAEYVQVKATEGDQLWSVAKLCQQEKSKPGTSIFEKSLARDSHSETSRFRILTLRPVVSELKVLTFAIGSEDRLPGCDALSALKAEFDNRFPELVSPKGNGCQYWLENCLWDQRHDEASICIHNELRVLTISMQQGRTLLPESARALLDDMRQWVKRAGAAKWVPDRARKIITRDQLLAWWDNKLSELTEAGGPSGGKLRQKMQAASLPPEVIGLALDLRRRYAERLRTPRYATSEYSDDLLDRVKAEALSLRSRYVADQIHLGGAAFHALCLERMDAINAERPQGAGDERAFLQGCMYDIADRCLLRFERV